MKQLYILATLAVAAFSFTSCEADKEPVYYAPDPATFVLNTPPFANQTYILETGGSVDLTTSQPDYGIATVTNYSVDITLADEFVEATEGDDTTPAKEANYVTLTPKEPTQAKISLDAKSLNNAIVTDLMGIKSFAQYPEEGLAPVKLTIRAHAWITNVASSECVSNNIVLESIQLYNPHPETGRTIYIVGSFTGWGVDSATPDSYSMWGLDETGVGTNVYVGAFDIPKGVQTFRFYTELGNWGDNGQLPSVGPKPNDGENVNIDFSDEATTISAVPGKGSWQTTDSWKGGFVTFTLDMNDPDAITVTTREGNWDTSKLKFIYLVGDCSAWSVSEGNAEEIYADFKLYDWENNGIYSNTFNVAADKATFRFYTELGNWDKGSLGSQVDDNPLEVTMTDGAYSGGLVEGKGSWKVANWAGGEMKMVVNTTDNTVSFSAAAE